MKNRKKAKIWKRNCSICKQEFFATTSNKKRKCCSDKCAKIAHGIATRGNKHFLFGKPRSEDVKRKISATKQGIIEREWKHFASSISYKERRRFRKIMQKQVFERDDYTCQMCGIKGIDLQVDHIQPWAEYIELRFSMDNCRTLCTKCHYKITFGKPMPQNIRGWGHNLLKGGE